MSFHNIPFSISLIFILLLSTSIAFSQNPLRTSIDHMPIAVTDLDKAIIDFKHLGFTIKPGSIHENSINNAHIKFENGASLELITATHPKDQLASTYLSFLENGDGPAFLSLSADSIELLIQRLQVFNPSVTSGSYFQWVTFPEKSKLSYLFFINYLQPFTEKTNYFNHTNLATELKTVTLIKSEFKAELMLFKLLDCSLSNQGIDTTIVNLSHQQLILIEDPNAKNQRPIKAVRLEAEDLELVKDLLLQQDQQITNRSNAIILPSRFSHGLEIELVQKSN